MKKPVDLKFKSVDVDMMADMKCLDLKESIYEIGQLMKRSYGSRWQKLNYAKRNMEEAVRVIEKLNSIAQGWEEAK